MQPPFILIENYVNIYNILNHIENNYKIKLHTKKNLKNYMIIDYNHNMNDYFIKISKKYNGNIIQNYPDDNKCQYSIILYDIYILQFLNSFYSNINYHINNKLYQDFINLYTNQTIYLDKEIYLI